MPSYDSSRGRFRLADRHIAVLGHLVDGETPPGELSASLGELQRIGLVGPEGELSPMLRDLVGAFGDPVLVVRVEVTGEHGPVNHGLVVGRDAVIAHDGWPGEEESEYLSIEPRTLVWELARMVNLRGGGPRTDAGAVEPPVSRIETTTGVLDAAFTALGEAGGGPDGSVDAADGAGIARKAVAEAGGPYEPQLSLFADLVAALTATWRVTTVWDGTHDAERAASLRALAVWDCGPLGYWLRERPEEPILPGKVGPDSALHLVRTTPAEIWQKLADLLPDADDLFGQG